MPINNSKDVSKHILPTSSNLLGICFLMLSFMKIWKIGKMGAVVADKLIGASMLLFLIASVLSYMSMRSQRRAESYEKFADIVFLIGLIFLTLIALFLTFEIFE
jgi:Na+/citrate or Na+/malate symporter